MGLIKQSGVFRVVLMVGLCVLPMEVYSAWSTDQEIISGQWGSAENQFGIMYQDDFDMFPRFSVTSNNEIVVRDGQNSRVKVYNTTGSFKLIVPYRVGRSYKELTIADKYGFSGGFLGYGENGANYYQRLDQNQFIKFTPIGELLQTYTARPKELGVITEQNLGGGKYKITITYPDRTYSIGDGPFEKYVRDSSENINAVAGKGADKYDACGKKLGSVIIPDDQHKVIHPGGGGFNEQREVIAEYGQAVVGPNGDIYTWKRTPDTYSILKWSWLDSPNDPKGGPDAPEMVQANPSTSGVYLTWNPSPQDPGCVIGYKVERSTSATGIFTNITTVSSDDKQAYNFNDKGATTGATWYYRVKATSEIGDSDAAEASAARP